MEPPRGRGKAFSVLRRQFRFRITPAWAGKRFPYRLLSVPDRDHPRVGGEKLLFQLMCSYLQGLPPHGRGKAERAAGRHRPAGITPAWAGKRLTRPAMTGTPRDHPRMGGEKLHLLLCVPAGYGSPPRRRGKDKLF